MSKRTDIFLVSSMIGSAMVARKFIKAQTTPNRRARSRTD
jgi:hypothetical protein